MPFEYKTPSEIMERKQTMKNRTGEEAFKATMLKKQNAAKKIASGLQEFYLKGETYNKPMLIYWLDMNAYELITNPEAKTIKQITHDRKAFIVKYEIGNLQGQEGKIYRTEAFRKIATLQEAMNIEEREITYQ